MNEQPHSLLAFSGTFTLDDLLSPKYLLQKLLFRIIENAKCFFATVKDVPIEKQFFPIGPLPALCFLNFHLFNTVDNNVIAYDWIRTVDLWYWKRPLHQLRHDHCPTRETVVQFVWVYVTV